MIIGLDIARVMGVAEGEPGAMSPASYTWTLGKPRGGLAAQCTELVRQLNRRLRTEPKVVLVAKEACFTLASFRDHGVSEEVVRSAFGLHAVVLGICGVYGIPCRDVPVATVTKHFTGKIRWGGRAERKRAVIARCHLLGYLPGDCDDDNRADALAVFDWAASTLARVPPKELRLFGERAA